MYNLMKLHPLEAELFHVDGRADGRTDTDRQTDRQTDKETEKRAERQEIRHDGANTRFLKFWERA